MIIQASQNIGAGFRTFASRVGAGIGIGLIFSGLGVQDNLYTFCEAASKESAKAADYSGFVLFVSGIAAVLLMQNPQLLESLIDKYFSSKSKSTPESVPPPAVEIQPSVGEYGPLDYKLEKAANSEIASVCEPTIDGPKLGSNAMTQQLDQLTDRFVSIDSLHSKDYYWRLHRRL